jgi:hypothetical protein
MNAQLDVLVQNTIKVTSKSVQYAIQFHFEFQGFEARIVNIFV